eukprot:CAMPEP_0185176704 /NCGR_PEP_ID=MMETSP1139-20130426/28699_1 /TAXON_ID=298111 /ORGANISM="Pavlova sp., Strain CCMP459" /LENGTH=54 /DNA_ID=CAMNT_0027742477 /DNA_START=40 /DNA_END=200 /DNA_ORIENTATION=-
MHATVFRHRPMWRCLSVSAREIARREEEVRTVLDELINPAMATVRSVAAGGCEG